MAAYTPKYDLALLEAARGGDKAAILSLLTAAQPDIRRYARRSCNSSADVDDAVQDTLLLLFRRVGTLRALVSVSAWLLIVVHRQCLRLAARAIGRSWGRNLVDIDDGVDHPAHRERLSRMPVHELRIDLARAIESLPEHYREVVLLRDVQELTVDEIGLALGLTREAVKGRLHRARALLREYLGA